MRMTDGSPHLHREISVRVVTRIALATILSIGASPLFAADPSATPPTVTLQEVVNQALTAAPDIQVANNNLQIAQATYAAAAAKNKLGLAGNASVNQKSPFSNATSSTLTSSPGTGTVSAGATLTGPSGLNVGASVSQGITEDSALQQTTAVGLNAGATLWDGYPGGQGLANSHQAALSLQSTQITENADKANTVYQVKQAYYSLLGQQEQVVVLKASYGQAQAEMKNTQALYNEQNTSEIALQQAKVNQEQANLNLLKAQDTLEVLREQLSALVGWPLAKAYTVADVTTLQAPTMSEADAVKTALAQRSDIKELVVSQESQQITLALKKAANSPDVNVTAGVSWAHGWATATDSLSLSAGLSIQGSIFNSGAGAAQVQSAAVQAQNLAIEIAQKRAQIETSVKSALASVRDLVARVGLAQDNVALSESQYKLTQIQLDNGVASDLDLLTASVNLSTAQLNLAQARSAAQLAILAFENTIGD